MAPKSRRKRARRTYTNQQREEVLAYYEQHGTSAAAKHFDIPKSTIDNWRKNAGVGTVRNEKMEEARTAAEVDASKLRAEASAFAIQGAREAFRLLHERIASNDDVSIKDLGIVAGILADKHLAFNSVDTDDGAADATSLLDRLAAQVGGDLDAE